jgi:hypothetical protein
MRGQGRRGDWAAGENCGKWRGRIFAFEVNRTPRFFEKSVQMSDRCAKTFEFS